MKASHILCLLALSVLTIKPAQAADAKPDPMATALGATGAQAVFSNFMAIAELADLYGAKAYDKEKAVQLADTYGKLTEGAKESLTDLIDSGKLSKEDTGSVQEMVIINDLLGKMSGSISTFVKGPSPENEAAYNKNREKAWKAIQKFLGIQE
jgi:hypothetical protein